MTPLTLELDRVRLRVDQRRGAGVVDAHWRGRDGVWLPVVARNVPGEDPITRHASFIMAPWCNRVRDAEFVWDGRRVALRADPRDGTAIHGDVRNRPFELVDRSPVSARLRLDSRDFAGVNFPWPFRLEARFEVSRTGFRLDLALQNVGDDPSGFPCGVGIHPYFPRFQTPGPVGARLIAPVGARFPSERCMPVGPARRDARCRRLGVARALPHFYFMDSFTGYENACIVEWPRSRVTMTSSENHRHMVFFAPTNARGMPEPFFAVEPMTIAADGFNLLARGEKESGVTALKPGELLRTWYGFEMEDR